jgi:hypothetical protein
VRQSFVVFLDHRKSIVGVEDEYGRVAQYDARLELGQEVAEMESEGKHHFGKNLHIRVV